MAKKKLIKKTRCSFYFDNGARYDTILIDSEDTLVHKGKEITITKAKSGSTITVDLTKICYRVITKMAEPEEDLPVPLPDDNREIDLR